MKNILLLLLILNACVLQGNAQSRNDSLTKKEKRYIHPRSKFISFSHGFGFTSNSVTDPNNFLTQGLQIRQTTYVPSFSYEHGLVNNFFAELNYSYIRQGPFHERRIDDAATFSYYGFSKNHNIQLGLGYRILNKNNFNFFILHGGLFIGVTQNKMENLPIEFDSWNIDMLTKNEYTITTNITDFNRAGYGAYLGISKDVRLSKDVRFFVKYIHQFGVRSVMSGTFELSSTEIDYIDQPATFSVKGGGAFITAGLKMQLFRNHLNK